MRKPWLAGLLLVLAVPATAADEDSLRIAITLTNGFKMEGLALKGVLYEKQVGMRWVTARGPEELGVGVRVWHLDATGGFLFLRYRDIKTLRVVRKVSPAEVAEIMERARQAREEAERRRLAAEEAAAAEAAGEGATPPPAEGAPPEKPAAEGATPPPAAPPEAKAEPGSDEPGKTPPASDPAKKTEPAGETKADGTTAADKKPADAKPGEQKPEDAKAADAKPGEQKPGDPKSGEKKTDGAAKPGEKKDGKEEAEEAPKKPVPGIEKLPEAKRALLEKFPPTEGWVPNRVKQIEWRKWSLDLFPNAQEKEFLKVYADWKTAYDEWKEANPEAAAEAEKALERFDEKDKEKAKGMPGKEELPSSQGQEPGGKDS
jgi:hypothetical protein